MVAKAEVQIKPRNLQLEEQPSSRRVITISKRMKMIKKMMAMDMVRVLLRIKSNLKSNSSSVNNSKHNLRAQKSRHVGSVAAMMLSSMKNP